MRPLLNNPFTGFLTHAVLISYENARATNNRQSIDALAWLIRTLDKGAQDKLGDILKMLEECIDGTRNINTQDFRRMYSTVTMELHEEGYFLAAKMPFAQNPNPKRL